MPTLMVAGAIALVIAALRLDLVLASGASNIVPWFGAMRAEAARRILTTVASTMVTVAGVVFSITIVVLQLASSQFGPRVLRNFMSDAATRLCLVLSPRRSSIRCWRLPRCATNRKALSR